MEDLSLRGSKVIMNTYNRYPLAFDHGEGVYVFDTEGKKYLDFVGGIAVNSLGHAHPALLEAISRQAGRLIHCSNLYYTEPQVLLAERLTKIGGFEKVFFCNSGAEAIEASLKLARKYAKLTGKSGNEIITMKNSFHGRTYGAVTATGQTKYQAGLDPLLPEISHVAFNDFDELNERVSEKTCAILMEPVQGEGGIVPADPEYLKKVRKLCTDKDIMLIFDEVQTGVGRSGEFFAFQVYGIKPDAVTLAKGLAGGVPIGALITMDKFAGAFKPGDHASTFGGNPLAAAAGDAVVKEITEGGLLENVKKQGELLNKRLTALKDKYPVIKDVRGFGLMQGAELSVPVSGIISSAMQKGLLLIGAGPNVIRFVPPLIVSEEQINKAIDILDEVLKDYV